MEAKELRIGNFISHEDTFKNGVAVDISLLVETTDKTNEFIPIELTEEWLVKFGFKRMLLYNDYFIKTVDGEFSLDSDDFLFSERNKKVAYDFEIMIACVGLEINYVHEFQNAYFCYTGKELEING